MSRVYVESVEYPDMVFGPDGFWPTCGYCGWDGPIYNTRREAWRARWRHPDFWCWLIARWYDWRWHPARIRAARGSPERKP